MKLTQTGETTAVLDWSGEADARGFIARLVESGELSAVLAAVADPMAFAEVAAGDVEAREQLRAVCQMAELLTKRRDALTVALRDRGDSWTELAKLHDPDADDHRALRSKVQRRYDAGIARTGLPRT